MNIKKLDKTILGVGEVKGFLFTQIKESDNGYIYQVDTEQSIHFELFKKKTTPVCVDFSNRIYSTTESKEQYPKSSDFGVWAWSYDSLVKAERKFSILNSL